MAAKDIASSRSSAARPRLRRVLLLIIAVELLVLGVGVLGLVKATPSSSPPGHIYGDWVRVDDNREWLLIGGTHWELRREDTAGEGVTISGEVKSLDERWLLHGEGGDPIPAIPSDDFTKLKFRGVTYGRVLR